MKKSIYLILVLTFITSCATQKIKINATKDASGNLVGVANKESFLQVPYQTWFSKNFNTYQVNKAVAKQLQPLLKKVTIKAFMGTWCGDSKRQTPPFYKILETAKFNLKNLEMITVNRSKKTPDNLQQGLHIFRVPTFIFYKEGKEIGRIVEYPRKSLEEDMLTILSGKPYKHSYDN